MHRFRCPGPHGRPHWTPGPRRQRQHLRPHLDQPQARWPCHRACHQLHHPPALLLVNPRRCSRHQLATLTDLPNVGPVIAGVLRSLGFATPADLIGRDGIDLYRRLCRQRGGRQDPCVLDVFLSIERFLAGEEPRPWWAYSQERRRRYPNL